MDPCQHLMRRMAFDLGMSPGLVTTAIIGVFWRLLPRCQGSEAFGRRSGTLASSASATPKGGAAYESCIARRNFRSRSLAVMLLRPSWFLELCCRDPVEVADHRKDNATPALHRYLRPGQEALGNVGMRARSGATI